jgi:hypothetical protein
LFADADSRITSADGVHVIRLQEHYGLLSPILHVAALQLLAYHTALARERKWISRGIWRNRSLWSEIDALDTVPRVEN